MKSLNSMKVFVVGTLSIGLFSSTVIIAATAAPRNMNSPGSTTPPCPATSRSHSLKAPPRPRYPVKPQFMFSAPKATRNRAKARTASAVLLAAIS